MASSLLTDFTGGFTQPKNGLEIPDGSSLGESEAFAPHPFELGSIGVTQNSVQNAESTKSHQSDVIKWFLDGDHKTPMPRLNYDKEGQFSGIHAERPLTMGIINAHFDENEQGLHTGGLSTGHVQGGGRTGFDTHNSAPSTITPERDKEIQSGGDKALRQPVRGVDFNSPFGSPI